MVAIVTGSGQGLVKSSLAALGSQGEIGTAKLGQNGSDVIVNAANGNLIVQSQDEMLFGVGLDDAITNTYNSQGTLTANGWQESYQRKVGSLTGTVNTAGSTITHTTADGSTVVYTYSTTLGKYVGNEMGGAYDTLAFNSSTNQWTWTEGKTRAIDIYDNANGGRLIQSTDTSNNSLTYTYTGSQLTKITTANGDYTSFVYTGALLTSVVTSYTNASGLQTATRVRYGYDASNRLTTVTTDLSPNDNSIADGKTYVTTYGYNGTSKQISSITQGDGSSLGVTYDGSGRVIVLTQTTASGVSRSTYFGYQLSGRTTITDWQGNVTTMVYDANGRLTQMVSPPATPGGGLQVQAFGYDANGNLTYSGPGGDSIFANISLNWQDAWTTDASVTVTKSTEVDGGVNVYRRQTTGTPAAGWQMDLGTDAPGSTAGRTAVVPGQIVSLSTYAASSGASALDFYADFYDLSGNWLSSTKVSGITPGGTLGASGTATANQGGGTVVVPSSAYLVGMTVIATASGTAPLNVAIAKPTISVSAPAPDASFFNITQNWGNFYTSNGSVSTTQSAETDWNVKAYRRQTTSTPAAGWAMNLGQVLAGATPVSSGQTVWETVYAASSGASSLTLYAEWYDANGNYMGSQGLSSIPVGGTLGASGTTTAKLGSGSAIVPSGAAYVTLTVQAIASGSGPLNVAIANPSILVSGKPSNASIPTYTYTYDSNGNRLTMTDALGNRTDYGYDGTNQLVSKTEAANSSSPLTTRYVYDAAARLVYTISPNGDVTQYVYNTNGTQKSVIRYTGNLYTTGGNPWASTMDSWVTTTDRTQTMRTDTTYDARGLVATVTTYGQTDSSGNGVSSTASTTTYVYDQAGLLLSRKLSSSTATETFVYDGLGRTISATDYNNKLTQTVYTNTASGLQTATTLANGTVRTSTYDQAGELISVSDSGGGLTATTTYVYDSVGNLIRTTDPTGFSTYHVYDTRNRKVADVAADGAIVAYGYNANDQVVSTTAYANRLTAAQLSLLANESNTSAPVRLATVTPPASASDRWSWTVYDADGRRVEDIDAQGAVTAYTYDAGGRLIATTAYAGVLSASTIAAFKTTPPTAVILPGADAANDRTTRTFYNNDDQVVATLDADGYLTEVVYDAAGRKVRTLTHATQTNSSHWAGGTLAQLQADAGSSSGDIYHWWVYDGRGLLRAEIDGEGNITRYDSYTAAGDAGTIIKGQVISTASLIATPPTYAGLPAPSGTLEITSLTYDQYGHVLTKSITLTGGSVETTTYTYDANYNQISQAVSSSSSATGGADGRTSTVKYDGLGRKIAELTGRGSAALAALGATPTQAQIDAVWASYQTAYTYDAASRLISQTDADGRRTLFYYDVDGRLTYRIDGDGGILLQGYDTFGEKSDIIAYTNKIAPATLPTLTGGPITSALNNAISAGATDNHTHIDYNVTGTVADTVDALGGVTTYGYNAFGQEGSRIDPLSTGVTTQTNKTYSRRGLLLTSTADVGGLALLTSYQYDAFGRKTKVTDPQTNTESWTYWRTGQVKTDTDGLNVATSYTYDGFGHVKTVIDGNGKLTQYDYKVFDRQVTVTDPNNIVTTTTKNAYGQTVKIVDGTGAATTFEYDADGNLTKTTDANGNATSQFFTNGGLLQTVTDANGMVTKYDYDGAGRVKTKTVDNGTGGLALAANWTYDGKGQILTQTTPAGSLTRSVYDSDNRVAFTIDAVGEVIGYTYDSQGRMTRTQKFGARFTDTGVQTLAQMQTWATTYSAGSVNSWAHYDAAGRMDYTIDPDNKLVTYTYDNDGRVVQRIRYTTGVSISSLPATPPDGSEVIRTVYDADGRKAFVIDAVGAVTGYTYDNDGRVIRTIQYAALNASTGVQTLAQMQAWANNIDPNNIITRSVYDAGGRLIYAVDPDGYVTGYTYDGDGRVVLTMRYPTPYGGWAYETVRNMYQTVFNRQPDANGWNVFGSQLLSGSMTALQLAQTLTASNNIEYQNDLSAYPDAATGNQKIVDYLYNNAFGHAPDAVGASYVAALNNGTMTLAQVVVAIAASGELQDRELTLMAAEYQAQLPSPSSPPAGAQITRYVYDAAGRRSFVVDPTGTVTGYTYDKDGNVAALTTYATQLTATGVQTLAQVNSWLNANSNAIANDVNNRTTSNTYDTAGRLATVTDAAGYLTSYDYDADSRVVREVRYPLGTTLATMATMSLSTAIVTNFAYDALGRKAFVTDPTGAVTGYTYDAYGNLQQTVQYATPNTNTAIQSLAQMNTWAAANASNSDNRTTSATYDNNGRVYTSTDARGYKTRYDYDFAGRVAIKTQYGDTSTRITRYKYDAAGNLTDVTDPLKVVTHYDYDTFGRLSLTTTAYSTSDAATTKYGYDNDGRLTSTTVAFGTTEAVTTSTSYYAQGWVYQKTDGRGNSVTYTYDNAGRVKTTTDATGAVTTNTYNAFGEINSVKDPNGNTGYFYYDKRGQQTMAVDAMGYVTEKTYDINGKVLSAIRYAGTVTVNSVNDPKPTMTFNAQTDNKTSFTYYNDGSLKTATDGNGNTTIYHYTAFGDRDWMQNAAGATTNYYYDKNGNLTSQVVPASEVLSGGAPIAPAVTTAYTYDAFGNRKTTVEAQGRTEQRTTTYSYDDDDHLTQQTGDAVYLNGTTTSVTPTQNYTYDMRGNAVTAQDANGAITVTYYDHQNRKVAQVNPLGVLTEWGYDNNGNVSSQKVYGDQVALPVSAATRPSPVSSSNCRTTTYTYDKDNRLSSTSIMGVETGAWNTGTQTWDHQTASLTTSTTYDLNGNAVMTTDANGNKTYFWYDKLGRKTDQVDAGGYMTSWVLDAEGNAKQQTQYATPVTVPVDGSKPATPPAPPAGSDPDRVTAFTYDHNGQRRTETRKSATYATVNGNSVSTTSGDVTVEYRYNNLNQVTLKIEATGDQTKYDYDKLGHLTFVTTAYGSAWANATAYTYDGLGNILTTTAGSGTSGAETTTFTYGAGGRLATQKDAEGFITTYGYDSNGQKTIEQYTRLKSDGTTSITESKQYGYDAAGQKILEGEATLTNGQWVFTQTVDSWYDAYGEVVSRGVNTGRNVAKAQEFADYDTAGRVWRSNMGDGVTKVYGYDKNGNATIQIQSQGTTDLCGVANLDAALAATGVTKTYSLYDSRNELTDVKRPVSANLDGTVASGGNAVVDTRGSVDIDFNSVAGDWGGTTTASVRVSFNSPSVTTANGTGKVHVSVTAAENTAQSSNYDAGVIDGGTYNLSFATSPQPGQGYTGSGKTVGVLVTVTQDTASGTITLASRTFTAVCMQYAVITDTYTPSSARGLRVTVPNATAATLYVRPTGSTGGYTAVTASQPVYDGNSTATPGAFMFDLSAPPFNGTAGSSWEVKYLATDASGKVVDAKTGTVTFDSASTPNPTATSFTSVPVFAAAQSGGSWTLTAVPVTAAYSDSSQTFNAFGDVLSQTDANTNTTNFTYDVLGNLVQKKGAWVTSVGENGVGTLVRPTDTYYYDKSGRQVGHSDANGKLTTQDLQVGTGYDGTAALVTNQYNPDAGVVRTVYDIFDNVQTVTDAMGAVTTNIYDKDNRLIEVDHATRSGTDLTYTSGISQLKDYYAYDGLGQRLRHWNNVYGASTVETSDYDLLGRVTKSVSFTGQATTYNYTWTAMTATGRVTAGQANIGSWTKTTGVWGQTSSVVTDYFGKMVSSSDFGLHTTSYSYDLNGQLTHQGSSAGQSLDYVYTTSGQIGSVTDTATGIKAVYAYDKNGNRTVEGYYRTGATAGTYQNSVISYDALNRVTEIRDANADITYAYDANGNRREVKTTYVRVDKVGTASNQTAVTATQDYWYTYDSMNRFVITKGTLVNGVITVATDGVLISYNARGDRKTAAYGPTSVIYSLPYTESYAYTTDGYLETVTIGNYVTASRTTDVLGNMRFYTEYQQNSSNPLSTRDITYDLGGRVTTETDLTYNGSTTYKSVVNNYYGAYNSATGNYDGADQGVIMQSKNVQTTVGSSAQPVTTTTTYAYAWWDQAKSAATTITGNDPNNPSNNSWPAGNASYSYDVNGNLTQVADTGIGRTVTYQTDSFGQVLTRKETDTYNGLNTKGAYRNFFYLNGHVVGDVGTDQLTSQVDYAQQLQTDRNSAATAGSALTGLTGTPVVGLNANFDENYQAYNATSVGQSAGGYTVMAGDTLQSIAQNVWGDSSLWYVLANANGLSAGSTLVAGQSLIIPNGVTNVHNSSSVFKPYNASDALGNTTPTLPQEPQPPAPKEIGCGMVGQILIIAVAVVVAAIVAPYAMAEAINLGGTAATAGFGAVATGTAVSQAGLAATAALMTPTELAMAGAMTGFAASLGSQVFAVGAGIQKKIDWKSVAVGTITGAVGGEFQGLIPGSGLPQMLERGIATDVVSQGVEMGLHMQKTFDWTSIAVAGTVALVEYGVSSALHPPKGFGATAQHRGDVFGPTADRILTGTAGLLAGAATQAAAKHESFGKSLMSALPEYIGSTIGDMIGDAIMAKPASTSQSGEAFPGDNGIRLRGVSVPASWAAATTLPDYLANVPTVADLLASNTSTDESTIVGDGGVANSSGDRIYYGDSPIASSGYGNQSVQNAVFRQVRDGNGNWVDVDAAGNPLSTGGGGVGVYKASALTLAPGMAGNATVGALRLAGLTEAAEAFGIYAGIFSRFSVLTMPLVLSGDAPQPKVQQTKFDDLVLEVSGPSPFSKSGTNIGDPGTRAGFAIAITKPGLFGLPSTSYQYLDVPVTISHGSITFDTVALSKAYGKDLPVSLVDAIAATEEEAQRTTCASIGVWEAENTNGWSANSIAYQAYITGHPNQQFVVPAPMFPKGTISFDGCVDLGTGVLLQEAKGQYTKVFQYGFAQAGVANQGQRQQVVIDSLLTEGKNVTGTWFVQEKSDASVIQGLFTKSGVTIPVIPTPMPKVHK